MTSKCSIFALILFTVLPVVDDDRKILFDADMFTLYAHFVNTTLTEDCRLSSFYVVVIVRYYVLRTTRNAS